MSEFTPGTIRCPCCRTRTFLQDAPWKLVCLACYLAGKPKRRTAEPPPAARAGAPIEPGMLRRLIQLCHPDKHGNSESSLLATCWLLALKRPGGDRPLR